MFLVISSSFLVGCCLGALCFGQAGGFSIRWQSCVAIGNFLSNQSNIKLYTSKSVQMVHCSGAGVEAKIHHI